MTPLLTVKQLRICMPIGGRPIPLVDGIDYDLQAGTVLGIAGESGSGKTMSALALLGLLPAHATVDGSARFDGIELVAASSKTLRGIRGKRIAMVFQDPMTALHPMMSVGRQLTEHMRRHLRLSRRSAREEAVRLLADVRIPDPASALDAFPHQFSGGMRQRIAIASALACNPQLLIADEPTTALDVTVQAGILRLLDDLRTQRNLAVILISHDLGVMSALADDVCVMYAGRIVEHGPRLDVLRAPRHPYTRALMSALPHPERTNAIPLVSIPGTPPSASQIPEGCAFNSRCRFAAAHCSADRPALTSVGDREIACVVDPFDPAQVDSSSGS